MTDGRRERRPRRASKSTSFREAEIHPETKQAPIPGHRAVARDDTSGRFRPAVGVTQRGDGPEPNGCSHSEEQTGKRPEDGSPPATDLERKIVACLAAAGALAPAPDVDDVPTAPAEIEALEREHEAWLTTQTEPLGLTEAVLADRE